MKRDKWQDELMARWLESGPDDVPFAPLEAAVAYARAHPRRRFSAAGLWRIAMDRMHVTDVTPVATRGRRFGAFEAVAVVAVAVIAVVGAASLLNNDQSSQPAGIGSNPTSTPTVAPATLAPTDVALPVPVEVTARFTCSTLSNGSEAAAGDVTQYRGVKLRCAGTASDPRLSGTANVAVSIDERKDGSADIWGTGSIGESGRGWRGTWSGTVDVGYTTHRITGVYIGTGDYEGLRVRWTQTGDETTFELTGTLERTDTIPPDGATAVRRNACSVWSNGTEEVVGGVTQYRGVILKCTGDASDPRLAGAIDVVVNIDEFGDESAALWSTPTITTKDGAWEGSERGTVDVGYTTHRLEGVLIGSGDYAGLEFRYTQIGEDPYIMTGTIGPAQ